MMDNLGYYIFVLVAVIVAFLVVKKVTTCLVKSVVLIALIVILAAASARLLLGKWKHSLLKTTAVVLSGAFVLSLILSFFHVPLAEWGTRLDLILLWVTVGLAILAMVVYAAEYLRSLKKPRE